VALKKPSELFNKIEINPFEEVKSSYKENNVSTIDEAFSAFQTNVNHIQSLNDFTQTFGTFSKNVEKIQDISEEIEEIKEDIDSLATKENLDDAMTAHLLYVKDSIAKVEEGIETLNTKSIFKIKNDFSSLAEKVNNFLSVDALQYKNDLLRSENRVDSNFGKLKDLLISESEDLSAKVEERVDSIKEEVGGINSKSLDKIRSEIFSMSEDLDNVIKKEIPRYKTFFAETELKTEKSLNFFTEEFKNKIQIVEKDYKEKVSNLNDTVQEFINKEIPKYKNLIVENKLESETLINTLKETLQKDVKLINDQLSLVTDDLESGFAESSEKVDKGLSNLQTVIDESKSNINDISSLYENLYKDFKKREIHEDKKLNEFKYNIETISNKVDTHAIDYDTKLRNEVGLLEEGVESLEVDVTNKIKDLKLVISINEEHIKKQDKYIDEIKKSVKKTVRSLDIDLFEKKNKSLVKKILYIENVLESFKEKTLTEGLLDVPPQTNNSDSLTPLDQKYATLDDLQNHYKIFINRIQQQLSTLGGGGETQLQYLDDIVGVATNLSAYDGMYLQVDTSGPAGKKFKFGEITVGAAGTWRYDTAGISTSKNIGIGTTSSADTALLVVGDAWMSGNLSVAGTVTHNDVQNLESIGIVTAQTGIRVITGGIDVSAGIVTIPSTIVGAAVTTDSQGVRVAGVVTATSFVGDGAFNNVNITGITTLGSDNGIGAVTVGVGTTALLVDGNARITGILSVGQGTITLNGSDNKLNVGTGITLNAATGKIEAPEIITSGTTGAFYPPVMNTTQRNALTVTAGAMVFNTTDTKLQFYDGSAWQDASGVSIGLAIAI